MRLRGGQGGRIQLSWETEKVVHVNVIEAHNKKLFYHIDYGILKKKSEIKSRKIQHLKTHESGWDPGDVGWWRTDVAWVSCWGGSGWGWGGTGN